MNIPIMMMLNTTLNNGFLLRNRNEVQKKEKIKTDECDFIPAPRIFEHKGYVLQQSGYNNHFMIFKDGKMVCHSQCTEKLDQKKAEENIDFFIDLMNGKIKPREKDDGIDN